VGNRYNAHQVPCSDTQIALVIVLILVVVLSHGMSEVGVQGTRAFLQALLSSYYSAKGISVTEGEGEIQVRKYTHLTLAQPAWGAL
jgi:hypothetical protein